MSINFEKYENMILYFIENSSGQVEFCKGKLYKFIYYADFVSHKLYKKSITGESYIKFDNGPLGKNFSNIETSLVLNKKIKKEFHNNLEKYSLFDNSKCNYNVFDENEKKILSKICETFKDYSVIKLSNQTHTEAPYLFAKEIFDEIKYDYSYDIDVINI